METHELIMASSIACGRVHTTTAAAATTELPNMVARLQKTDSLGLPSTSLMLDIHTIIN